MTRRLLFLLFLPVLVLACVTEYQPDTISLPPALVVEGQITDQPGPYSVKLTRTADYTLQALNLLETGAVVSVEDDQGNRETLQEVNGGLYQTRAGGIRGVAGRRYSLTIQTRAGLRYQSAPELLTAAPPILKLYTQYRNELLAGTDYRKQGWDLYLDTKDPETPGNYYRWEWIHYNYTAICASKEQSNGSLTGLYCCTDCWDVSRCYNCISVNSDANINGQAINGQLIMRAPYTSRAAFYVEVEQQSLSRGAYAFWKSVRQLVNNTGGLFDAAPQTVQGNLRCLTDPALPVYGYFGATGITRKPFYIDRSQGEGVPDIPRAVVVPPRSPCAPCENSPFRTSVKPQGWLY